MAYKYSFCDNESYGAEDINNITKRLVTAGVEDAFVDGVPYNLKKINEAGSVLYTPGTVAEDINTLRVENQGDGTVLINPGTAFFADGAVMEISEGGHSLSIPSGEKSYVYLMNDLANSNACYPACTTEVPTGDYVMLAEISADGTVLDKRTYAMGKLPGYQSNSGMPLCIADTCALKPRETVKKSYTIGDNHYKYLLAVGYKEKSTQCETLGIYRFTDGAYLSFCREISETTNSLLYDWKLCLYAGSRWHASADVSFSEGVLNLSIRCTDGLISASPTSTFPILLYLF